MAENNTNTTPVVGVDEEYKNAIQPVVDDAMRTDALGAKFCVVLNEHKPTDEAIKKIMSDAIVGDLNVKSSLETAINEIDGKRKVRWIDRSIAGGLATAVTIGIAWVISLFK